MVVKFTTNALLLGLLRRSGCACLCALLLWIGLAEYPVQAATIAPYVLRYLDAREPVSLPLNAQGENRSFSAADLSEGMQLFEENCINCHVGGSTLPNPLVPLSLDALRQATPSRNTIEALVAFMRQPMTYDGGEEEFLCRQVPERWLSQSKVENLAAFVLRSAQKAPGWGSTSF